MDVNSPNTIQRKLLIGNTASAGAYPRPTVLNIPHYTPNPGWMQESLLALPIRQHYFFRRDRMGLSLKKGVVYQ